MVNLLVRLMFVAALTQFGLSLAEVEECHSSACLKQMEIRSRDVLKIDWKPLSVFPEEARRFRGK